MLIQKGFVRIEGEGKAMYYNLDFFKYLENAKGDYVELLTKVSGAKIDNDMMLGLASKDLYHSKQLQGYAVYSKYSKVGISLVTERSSEGAEYRLYVNSDSCFSPSEVTGDSFAGVNGRYYQLELTEPIMERGILIYYGYRLLENDQTKVFRPTQIISKETITRKYIEMRY